MPEYRREQRIKIGCVYTQLYAANFNTLLSPILRHVYYFVFHLSGPKFRFVLFGCCFLCVFIVQIDYAFQSSNGITLAGMLNDGVIDGMHR